ncbi:hypothetical protein K432DRAFT_430926 [Lepidopterella palustris CBS 459.81]|uniref:Uncharacterized protein n=1 Tax=Lepidopterella palustris CBS 459.81 TaxID=1314670 RepID=A0A8E2J7N8_9PEZI|nr:hypothetical protein K432DRAFT_430926 [Lepidopterella palustris CBS 459.81]
MDTMSDAQPPQCSVFCASNTKGTKGDRKRKRTMGESAPIELAGGKGGRVCDGCEQSYGRQSYGRQSYGRQSYEQRRGQPSIDGQATTSTTNIYAEVFKQQKKKVGDEGASGLMYGAAAP